MIKQVNSQNQNLATTKVNAKLPANYHYIPDEYKDVASSMETQFAEYMIEQMEKTVPGEEKNSAESFHQSLINQERAKMISNANPGLGIKDLILGQIYPAHLRNATNYNLYQQRQDMKRAQPTATHPDQTRSKEY